eukprot:TRINITY_DN6567_c1_g1_i1.p2 TRINITY_DN6567_c1_g1~~TRINITY_DN6567_c1_g1_i1.p2  ORF type:complete len:192 (-),score=45.46 TRINITY_DN6567_c1_g1_i1:269-844(-)
MRWRGPRISTSKSPRGMMATADGRAVLRPLLEKMAAAVGEYAVHQIDEGAHAVQLFDSWAHHLSPAQYRAWALPYARTVAAAVRAAHPGAPVLFFANGAGGKLEDIAAALGDVVDVVSLDWSVGMAAARSRLGAATVVQGNSDPMVLFAGDEGGGAGGSGGRVHGGGAGAHPQPRPRGHAGDARGGGGGVL